MITPDANIIVTVTPTDWGYTSYSYRWEGGEIAILHASFYRRCQSADKRKSLTTKVGTVLYLGQFRLRIVSRDDYCVYVYVMRDGWKARLYAFVFPTKDLLTKIYHRLILTAFVWGLADHDWAAVPTWRDVKALRWIAQKVKR